MNYRHFIGGSMDWVIDKLCSEVSEFLLLEQSETTLLEPSTLRHPYVSLTLDHKMKYGHAQIQFICG